MTPLMTADDLVGQVRAPMTSPMTPLMTSPMTPLMTSLMTPLLAVDRL